jgi:hypothetical protein
MERMQATKPDQIGGDRRADKRYEIHLDLRWKLVRRRRVLETGGGYTVDLSSGGILFEAGRQLPVGFHLEISISWPIMLHSVSPLQLVVKAKIVRSQDTRTAVRIQQHEFRTAGQTTDARTRGAAGPLRLIPGLDRPTRLAKVQ